MRRVAGTALAALSIAAVGAALAPLDAAAQATRPGASAAARPGADKRASTDNGSVETYHVQGNVYMLVGAGANVAVQVGRDGVLVVDTGATPMREALLAAIRKLSDGPIRWIVNTSADPDHTGGNETISQAGMTVNGNPAAIISHENVLARMTAENRPGTELPLNTFFEAGRDFSFNGEAIFLYHFPAAHTDGDVVVYFRGSDVLVAGDLFGTTTYPVIRLDQAGGVDGFVAGLNSMLDVAVPKDLEEGGTYVIPGHGRIGDEYDLVEYRDMVVILRDRIANLVNQGMTLQQVMATKPALDYDPRYGNDRGQWTSANFVEAVYNDLKKKQGKK